MGPPPLFWPGRIFGVVEYFLIVCASVFRLFTEEGNCHSGVQFGRHP